MNEFNFKIIKDENKKAEVNKLITERESIDTFCKFN